MIGLVLVAGKGVRLGFNNKNKCMLEIDNKPLIEYSLDRLSEITDKIIIVVGYKGKEIQCKYGIEYSGIPLYYIVQPEEKKGIIGAIDSARDELTDNFYLALGDEILINSRHREMVYYFTKSNLFGLCGIIYEDNSRSIRKTYSVEIGTEGIYRLIEKPKIVLNSIKGTGNCVFKKEILSYLDKLPVNNERKESDFVSLVQAAINDRKRIEIFSICDKYFNINTKEDLLEIKGYFNI